MKKIFIPLILFLSFLISKPVFAVNTPSSGDIKITCNNSECTKLSGNSLFYETNIYPGFTTSQKISVVNDRNSTCHLAFKANSNSQESDILSKKISINISSANSVTDYQPTNYLLSDLFNSSQSLGHVHKGDTNKYLWSIVFNLDADNSYQNQNINFNIDFNFECDNEEPTITPTSTPTSGSVLGSTSTSTECTNSVPESPTDLVAYRNNDGSVRLNWNHSSSVHDGYLIAFGTSPGVYQYGAPDVGNIESYTVQGLTYGAQYCFYVRSLNGCMPGGRTPEYCVNPGSTVSPVENTPPAGFQPEVLGANTEENIIPAEEPQGNVLGAKDDCKNWLPLLFIAAFLINIIYISFSKKYILIPVLISLIAFIADKYILKSHCCYGSNWFCNYFWIGSILSCLVPILIKVKSRKITISH